MPLPNLVIAGVTKAGTTSLYDYLAQHRDIYAPPIKELNYFAPVIYGEACAPLDQYAAHFELAAAARWRLDASPFYFVGGRQLAEQLTMALPEARVVIALRDPVARLWSSYTFKRSKGQLPTGMTFSDFFETCHRHFLDGSDLVRRNSQYLSLRTGRYSDYLGGWLDIVGANLRVVFAEDLARAGADVMHTLFDWLDIDADVSLDLTARNKTEHPRSIRARAVAAKANELLTPILARRPALKQKLRGAYSRLNSASSFDVLSDGDRDRVRAFYQDTTERCAEVLIQAGYRELPSWLRPCITPVPGGGERPAPD